MDAFYFRDTKENKSYRLYLNDETESQSSTLAATHPANKLAPMKQAPLALNLLYAGRRMGDLWQKAKGCPSGPGKAWPLHLQPHLGCFFVSRWELQKRNQGAKRLWRASPLTSQPGSKPGEGRAPFCNFPGDKRGIHSPGLSILHLLSSTKLTLIRKGVKRFLISLIT